MEPNSVDHKWVIAAFLIGGAIHAGVTLLASGVAGDSVCGVAEVVVNGCVEGFSDGCGALGPPFPDACSLHLTEGSEVDLLID